MKQNKVCANELAHQYWKKNQMVLGIDEAGRGPLAGPLIVAGVVFPIGYENPDIYDSKNLSAKKRNLLFDIIQNDAEYFQIRIVSEKEIDRYNIYRADQIAMTAIAIEIPCDVVLTDAMPLTIEKEVIPLIKGDQKEISIAAASILAKVTRDRIMEELDKVYPYYGFAQNKGYPTKQHLEAIATYGIIAVHRKSFGPVKAQQIMFDL